MMKILTGIFIVCVMCTIISYYRHNKMKKLELIQKAINNKCVVLGIMSCLTMHGYKKPEYFVAEYMYEIDHQIYFVSYKIAIYTETTNNTEKITPDMLLMNIKRAMILYYNPDRPSNVINKAEIFVSTHTMEKIETKKKNAWRNINSEWTNPVDLVQY